MNLNQTWLNLNLRFGSRFSQNAELNLRFSSGFGKILKELDQTKPVHHYVTSHVSIIMSQRKWGMSQCHAFATSNKYIQIDFVKLLVQFRNICDVRYERFTDI